jgi:hypothetical protein
MLELRRAGLLTPKVRGRSCGACLELLNIKCRIEIGQSNCLTKLIPSENKRLISGLERQFKIAESIRLSAISWGLARSRSLVGEKPTQAAVSHGPGIQPCRCSGNPAQAGLTVKVLRHNKTVMGEADGVYGPVDNSPLYVKGECKGPPRGLRPCRA